MTDPSDRLSQPTRRAVAAGLAATGLIGAGITAAQPGKPAFAGADYPPTQGEMQGFVLLKERAPAPNQSFFDGDDNVRHFSDFAGEVLLVNFWATWCAPCIKEMPSLARLDAELKDAPFRLLAVSQDRGGKDVAEPFIRDRLNLPDLQIFYDPKLKLGRSLGVRGLPSTYLIDATGRLVGGLTGPAEWDGDDALALIRHVLGEGGTPKNATTET
ncbi:TlpA family protein disulfide reductase [Pacificispira sp.]|uniref:TlpA family protein disulfide reductase n=1 Tax=Pacificispira sp. TaxID=2888761 RepID=UPI003BAD9DFB